MEKDRTHVYLSTRIFHSNKIGNQVAAGEVYTCVAPKSERGKQFSIDDVNQRADFHATHISQIPNLSRDPDLDIWSVAREPVLPASEHVVFRYDPADPYGDLAANIDERFPIDEDFSDKNGYTVIITS